VRKSHGPERAIGDEAESQSSRQVARTPSLPPGSRAPEANIRSAGHGPSPGERRWARRSVSGPTSERPIQRTFPWPQRAPPLRPPSPRSAVVGGHAVAGSRGRLSRPPESRRETSLACRAGRYSGRPSMVRTVRFVGAHDAETWWRERPSGPAGLRIRAARRSSFVSCTVHTNVRRCRGGNVDPEIECPMGIVAIDSLSRRPAP